MTLRAGIIGYGEFAEFCHQHWALLEGIEVVAASDRVPGRVPGELRFFEDWNDLIRDPGVDIVTIGTPPSLHTPMAVAALRARKHVLVEKPPAMNTNELEDLLSAARESGQVCAVDYMLRYNPVVDALKALADSRLLGDLKHVSVSNYAYDGKLPPAHWFWDKALSGGILVEHAVHFFDMVSYVWPSRPVSLTAHGVCRQPGMEDKVVASVAYEDGLIGTHYHHFFRPWWFERQSFRFGFERGEADMEGWIPLSLRLRALGGARMESSIRSLLPGANVTADGTAGQDSGGEQFVTASIEPDRPKMDVYADCLRAAMSDLARAIRDRSHTPRISIERCADSIRIASAGARYIADGRAAAVEV